jgi:hypothetical protein
MKKMFTDEKSCSPEADATLRHQPSQQAEISPSQPGNSETQGFLRGAISIFILFHLIAIVCWTLPADISPVKDVKEIVRPYMIWSGLFQSWDFFAPNPKSDNSYIEADVITRNHTQKVWVFPRMAELSFGERYSKERYRKFAEVLPQQKNAYIWPGVAKHIAEMFKSQTDPPEMVLLIEFQAFMKPGPRHRPEPVLRPHIFYEYADVQPEDLK